MDTHPFERGHFVRVQFFALLPELGKSRFRLVHERRFDCILHLPEMWETYRIERKNGQKVNDGFEWLCRNRSSVKEDNHHVFRECKERVLV
ncbi:hypothetical protein TNCV_647741 [Trichonephila clavipes]|uniref:Uncharacterized protein n=1 Tax=Trichonephila clavipes TaxID=2585209 RepID=A0A8X6SNT6_TRICX|nr:hypothetical protein TNCV_647741 [Trichonephila clavipes]